MLHQEPYSKLKPQTEHTAEVTQSSLTSTEHQQDYFSPQGVQHQQDHFSPQGVEEKAQTLQIEAETQLSPQEAELKTQTEQREAETQISLKTTEQQMKVTINKEKTTQKETLQTMVRMPEELAGSSRHQSLPPQVGSTITSENKSETQLPAHRKILQLPVEHLL